MQQEKKIHYSFMQGKKLYHDAFVLKAWRLIKNAIPGVCMLRIDAGQPRWCGFVRRYGWRDKFLTGDAELYDCHLGKRQALGIFFQRS